MVNKNSFRNFLTATKPPFRVDLKRLEDTLGKRPQKKALEVFEEILEKYRANLR